MFGSLYNRACPLPGVCGPPIIPVACVLATVVIPRYAVVACFLNLGRASHLAPTDLRAAQCELFAEAIEFGLRGNEVFVESVRREIVKPGAERLARIPCTTIR